MAQALTPQEERAHYEELLLESARARRDFLALAQGSGHWGRLQERVFSELEQSLDQGLYGTAYHQLYFALNYEDAIAREGPLRQVGYELLGHLNELKDLQVLRPLPTPWDALLPGEFFQKLQEDPRALRDLLLTPRHERLTPQEGLLQNLANLRDNLQHWFYAPSLLEGQSVDLRPLYKRLCEFCEELVGTLNAQEQELCLNYMTLLRWRLERCEDPLALPHPWRLSQWINKEGLLAAALELLEGLRGELFQAGESRVSVALWDVVMELVLGLVSALDEEAENMDFQEADVLLEEFRTLQEARGPLAEGLASLELEGFQDLELPQELRELFVQRLFLEVLSPRVEALAPWGEGVSVG